MHKQIAIAHPRIELQNFAAQMFLNRRQQFAGFFRRDVTGGEVAHRLVFDRHQIAADGPIFWPKLNALGRGF